MRPRTCFFWGCLIVAIVFYLLSIFSDRYYYDVDDYDDLIMGGNESVINNFMATEVNITMCTMVKNEAKYVREWVEFHSLVGVSKFIIFDNDSADSLKAALNGTIADVMIIRWPPPANDRWPPGNPHEERCRGYEDGKYRDEWAYTHCQTAALHECLRMERGRSRWVAGVDVDEFFMPKYNKQRLHTLQYALKPYEHMHGISLSSFTYGTGHHVLPIAANELMIETHLLRGKEAGVAKEFVNPMKVDTYNCVHWAHYIDPLWNAMIMRMIPRSNGQIRYNHYPFRSVIESRHKVFKNMNPQIYDEIDKWDKVNIKDPYLLPMVPLVKRRLAGERIWIHH